MSFAAFVFGVIFLLTASAGLLLFNRVATPQQISAVAAQGAKTSLSSSIRRASASLGGLVGHFDTVLPRTKAEVSVTRQRLIRAGYREDAAIKIFYGAKFVLMVTTVVLVVATGLASLSYFFVILLALAFGFLAPDFWLGRRVSTRQRRIRLGLPDVLDLLIVCIEAGLSMDQATARTAEELGRAQSATCDELRIVVLEQHAGCPRSEAWKHFAERTDVAPVRNLVSMIAQSEQFGTSIARTLRVHSDSLRTQRIQQVEEQAAKTTIKMLFPLVLFIFPNIFLVSLGPAVILMMESFHNNFSH